MIIRNAAAGDYGDISELFDGVGAIHTENLPAIFQEPNVPVPEAAHYQALIADQSVALLVADDAGKLLGFVHAVVQDAPPNPILAPRRYVTIEGIGVKPEFQNQGVGRRLMDSVHEWAVKNGAQASQLNVYEFNEPAISFYHTLGYNALSRKMSRPLTRDQGAG